MGLPFKTRTETVGPVRKLVGAYQTGLLTKRASGSEVVHQDAVDKPYEVHLLLRAEGTGCPA